MHNEYMGVSVHALILQLRNGHNDFGDVTIETLRHHKNDSYYYFNGYGSDSYQWLLECT